MKNLVGFFWLGIILFVLSGCSSPALRHQSLTLSKIDSVNLSTVNSDNAISIFGKPDVREFIGKENAQVAMAYFNNESPPATKLALIFDSKTKELISANWFVSENDPESQFAKVQKRYPTANFNVNDPNFIKQGLYGIPVNSYQSTSSPLKVFVNEESKLVSALSWTLKADILPEKRKPTSH